MDNNYPWGGNRRFHSYNQFLKKQFGGHLRKIAIDAGFTCPNRDGKSSTGGCTFCLNRAFNPFYCNAKKSITQQLNDGIAFYQQRRNEDLSQVLAYFQAFSNTYASLPTLKRCYGEALAHPAVKGLIIATRPDCINEPLLDYLNELQQSTYVALEIGIESCYDETLGRINRGHDVECAFQAIEQVAKRNIPVGTHLIFGLPGESPEQSLEAVKYINQLPLHNIKFHQLQIIKNTIMELDYRLHPDDYYNFSFKEYINYIATYLEHLSPNIIVERFASELPTRYLVRPGWGGVKYNAIVKAIEDILLERNTWQGCRL